VEVAAPGYVNDSLT